MQKLAKKRWVIVAFAILMVVGMVAAYMPLLFPPQEPQISQNTVPEQPAVATSTPNPQPIAEVATTTYPKIPEATSSKKLPDAFSGIQNEQKSLDSLNNLLNQTPQ